MDIKELKQQFISLGGDPNIILREKDPETIKFIIEGTSMKL